MSFIRYIGMSYTKNATDSQFELPMAEFTYSRPESEIEISTGFGRANQSKRGTSYSGEFSYDLPLDHTASSLAFFGLLGKEGYTHTTGIHRFIGTGTYTPTYATYFIRMDENTFKLANAAVTELSLSAEDSHVSCSVNGLFSYDEIAQGKDISELNNPLKLPMMFHETKISIDGKEISKSRSVELTINQGGEVQNYLGTRYPEVIYTGVRTIEGTFSRDFTDLEYVKKLWGGTSSTKGGEAESKTFELTIEFTRNDGTGSVKITLPKAYLKNVNPSIGDRERATEEMAFAALEDSVTGTDIIVEIKNDLEDLNA